MKKKLVTALLALALAVSLAAPAAAREETDPVRWLDFELPEDLVEQIRRDQEEYPGYYSLTYMEAPGLLSVGQAETYGEGWVFDVETGEQTDYFAVYPLSEDLYAFTMDDETYGLMDAGEKVLLDPVCRYPRQLGRGLYGMVSESEGEAYLVDGKGKILETYSFDDGFTFNVPYYMDILPEDNDGMYFEIDCDGRIGIIDASGDFVVSPGPYRYVGTPIDGLVAFENEDWLYGVMDLEGNIILEPKYENLTVCDGGFIVVQNEEGLYGVLDREGGTVIPFTYPMIGEVEKGLISVRDGDYDEKAWGVIDTKGNVVVPFEYGNIIFLPEESCIRFYDDTTFDKMGLMDWKGREILPAEYDWIYPLGDGAYSVSKDGRCGLVDEHGGYLLGPFRGIDILLYEDTAVIYAETGGFKPDRVVDLDGEELLDLGSFDRLDTFLQPEGAFIVQEGDKMGLYNVRGEELLPVRYDVVYPSDSDGDGLRETFTVMDGRRVGFYILPSGKDDADGKPDEGSGFPWLWVGLGIWGAAVVIAVVVIVVVVTKKKKKPAPAAVMPPVTPVTPKFCAECGAPVAPGDLFCRNCGKKL